MREKVGKGIQMGKHKKASRRGKGDNLGGGKPTTVKGGGVGGLVVARNDATNSVGVIGRAILPNPERVESVLVLPSVTRRKGIRPGFINEKPYEHKGSPWEVFRHRTSRAGSQTTRQAIVCLPYKMAITIVEERKSFEKLFNKCINSIEDYNAMMANPQWMNADRQSSSERLLYTLQNQLTELRRLNK